MGMNAACGNATRTRRDREMGAIVSSEPQSEEKNRREKQDLMARLKTNGNLMTVL
jgi:hypothetical protein